MKRCAAFYGLLVLALVPDARAQQFLNLDFERATAGAARGWYQGGAGYEVVVDSVVAYSGEKSLRIRSVGEGNFGVATASFPVDDAAGKHVRFTGYIKTEDVDSGFAGLWWRVDGAGGVLAFHNMGGRGPTGTTPWTQYEIELDVDSAVQNINFGVLMPGRGTAWFDGLQVELDGDVYVQVAPEPFVPTAEQLAWVTDRAIPFRTAEPGTDIDDLVPLKQVIGDARIVALGEGTHGTREFFKMKHRLTQFLAQEMGFTVFAIEANMPEARRVNAYVLRGEGDPRQALAGMYFWTWNTQEVLDMIEWMREYNASGAGHIEFWGFDVQTPHVSMDSVQSFVARSDPPFADSVSEAYRKVRESHQALRGQRGSAAGILYEPWEQAATAVLQHLEASRERYLKTSDSMEVEWAIQNARIVLQGAQAHRQGPSRDESMADNVDWILAHTLPETKIVSWAHNGHVSRAKHRYQAMGSFLSERHADDLIVFGFAFHEGDYTAVGKRGLGTYGTSASEPGSLEWALHLAGIPRLIIDIRGAGESPESAWLKQKLEFRSIGAMAMDYAFYPTVVTDQFDVLIYFEESHPSVVLQTPRPTPGK